MLNYLGYQVYLRQIGKEYFEYLAIIEGEIYSSYIIMKPAKGKKRLTKKDVQNSAAITLAGAMATIETYLEKKEKKEGDSDGKGN